MNLTYEYLIPDLADIALETIEYDGKISGRVDFIGMQKNWDYPYWPYYYKELLPMPGIRAEKIDGNRKALSLFMSKLDAPLREKIHVARSSSGPPDFHGCLSPWSWGHYMGFLNHQKEVNDSLSCVAFGRVNYAYQKDANDGLIWRYGTYVSPDNTNRSKGKMVSNVLSRIKRYSYADYFLLIAITPLEYSILNYKYNYKDRTYEKIDQANKKAKVALLTIIYNRDGKKIYSKIYEESLDDTDQFDAYFLYDCTMKLIEKQGAQISKDLSFLLAPDDAPEPTLEDLHNRLLQPGTLSDDTKYLKEFQKKEK
ncbi:MAG: hypothetical protein FWG13_01860 [Leptospirales bacterium]|nr:hypothetical protein [Leptospirales bacterium]